MDFNYTFHYRLSYQEAYDTFYLLATRLTRKKKIIYGILLTAIAVLSLVFYGLDTRKVHLCLLAIFAAVLLFYLFPFHNMVIRLGGHKIDQPIYQSKDQYRTCGTANEQFGICHTE